jgi:hypothetical protein
MCLRFILSIEVLGFIFIFLEPHSIAQCMLSLVASKALCVGLKLL